MTKDYYSVVSYGYKNLHILDQDLFSILE